MARTYNLKNNPLDRNRLYKVCKSIIDECNEDRTLALEMHRFFREMLDNNEQDGAAKSLMVESLKLAQSSKQNAIKVVDMLMKLEIATEKASGESKSSDLFSELDKLTN